MRLFYGNKKPEYYKGILIKADNGLHQQIAESVLEFGLKEDSKILDFGCGEGALSQRLKDLGFLNILSVDINKEDFKADTNFSQLDFNNRDSIDKFVHEYEEHFDLVLGIEVIEHVQNHYDYVRSLKNMVNKDKYILITTPNITSWLSRLYFLFTGRLHQFMENDISYGHVNPISLWQLKYIFKNEKIELVKQKEIGILPMFYFSSLRPKQIVLNLFSLILTPLMKGEVKFGWCLLVIGKKT